MCQRLLADHANLSTVRALILVAVGALLIVGPVAGWLMMKVPLQDFWFMLFAFPATAYPATRSLPFPVPPNPIGLITGTQSLSRFNESFVIYTPLLMGT